MLQLSPHALVGILSVRWRGFCLKAVRIKLLISVWLAMDPPMWRLDAALRSAQSVLRGISGVRSLDAKPNCDALQGVVACPWR